MRQIGSFSLDAATLSLHRGASVVPLAGKTAELLVLLSDASGEVVPRDRLQARLWPEGFVEERNLAQQVYLLRKVLAADAEVRIENVPRRGYRLVCPAPAVPAPKTAATRPSGSFTTLRWSALAVLVAVLLSLGTTGAAVVQATLPDAAQRALALGRLHWEQRDGAGMRRARDYFAKVARLAPADARGYAGLALVDAVEANNDNLSQRASAALDHKAEREAQAALALDPENADAHAVIGLVELSRARPDLAETAFARAQRSDPRHAYSHVWRGIALLRDGRVEEARSEFKTGVSLEPTSKVALVWLAQADYAAKAYDSAETGARAALTLDGQLFEAGWLRVAVAEVRHDYRAALGLARALPGQDPRLRAERALTLARLEAELGNRRLASRLFAGAPRSCVSPLEVAITQLALGDRPGAVKTIRAMRKRGAAGAESLRAEMRLDPRYAGILAMTGSA